MAGKKGRPGAARTKQERGKSAGRRARDASGLTAQEARFVAEYLVHNNGARAAIAAGYSEHTARAIAHEVLRRPRVRAALEAGRQRIAARLEITAERVVQEMARLAFVDHRRFYDADGNLKPIPALDDDTAAALHGFEDEYIAATKSHVRKIRVHDKRQALEWLGNYLRISGPQRVESRSVDKDGNDVPAPAGVLVVPADMDLEAWRQRFGNAGGTSSDG